MIVGLTASKIGRRQGSEGQVTMKNTTLAEMQFRSEYFIELECTPCLGKKINHFYFLR